MVVQLTCNEQVGGSSPSSGSFVKTVSANFHTTDDIGKEKDQLIPDGVDLVGEENFVTPIVN